LEKNINILRMGFPIQYLSIDIDSIEDWVLAEKLAESKKIESGIINACYK
jgi:CMP-N-acetylneuraminic acid synthetase